MDAGRKLKLLLEVWREVGRHIEITESVRRVAPILAEAMPLERVLVRRIDVSPGLLETVAEGAVRRDLPSLAVRDVLDPSSVLELLAWCRQGEVRCWEAAQLDAVRRLLAPPTLTGALAVGPLLDGDEPVGLMLVEASQSLSGHASFLRALLEPLAAALANDRRLAELARLREAVEAENRALLTRLERENISDSVVGVGSGLKEVMARVEQVARTDAPVLILGETGSGKEVVARAIHNQSRRATGPFLRVNCGAIPPELVDSELFGHERGSFTGAINTRKGWFERADGGTLFLDEVAELPPAAQVRLLRVLQDGTFERVGAQRVSTADVRIVAATHRDMHGMVRDGSFRQDLWYRISVFPVVLPPLRDRREDIPALAAHFSSRAGLRLFGVPLAPRPEDLRSLVAYDWPGNVRELAAVVERAAILGDGRTLALKKALGAYPAPGADAVSGPSGSSPTSSPTLEDAMRSRIEEALRAARGRIEGESGAARMLDVNPHTLRARMRRLGIDWSRFRARAG